MARSGLTDAQSDGPRSNKVRGVSGDDETVIGGQAPAPLAADRRAGTEIAGYALEAIAGRGGMGVVYRARQLTLDRTVALKLLDPELVGDDPGFRARFLREARIAAAIDHPGVVPVHDAGEDAGALYIAMRWIDGPTLEAQIDAGDGLAPARAHLLLSQVAAALDAAHAAGVVHRDVKPGNVLLEGDRAYLSDFGLTKNLSSETQLTATGQFVGTADYIAPEQVQGREAGTPADVYSFGCVLYEALTGRPPYVNEDQTATLFAHLSETPQPPSALRPGLPAGVDDVVARAMARKPQDRYATAGEAAAALGASLGQA
jgi:serine/threonine protein kinase